MPRGQPIGGEGRHDAAADNGDQGDQRGQAQARRRRGVAGPGMGHQKPQVGAGQERDQTGDGQIAPGRAGDDLARGVSAKTSGNKANSRPLHAAVASRLGAASRVTSHNPASRASGPPVSADQPVQLGTAVSVKPAITTPVKPNSISWLCQTGSKPSPSRFSERQALEVHSGTATAANRAAARKKTGVAAG